MIDSLTIFSKTGRVLYHHSSSHVETSSTDRHVPPHELENINKFLSQYLLHPNERIMSLDTTPISLAEYYATEHHMVVMLYPKVVKDHADMSWSDAFLKEIWIQFSGFLQEHPDLEKGRGNKGVYCLFDEIFQAVYDKAQTMGKMKPSSSQTMANKGMGRSTKLAPRTQEKSMTKQSGKASKKEARVWYDGEQEVTLATMAKLDRSKNDSSGGTMSLDPMAISEDSPAFLEAKAAYLPTEDEIPTWEQEEKLKLLDEENDEEEEHENGKGDKGHASATATGVGWGGSLKSIMDHISGKVLTDQDLEQPLKDMENILTGKNVARDIAQEICASVRTKLVGKKMTSFTRVKTAVRQALEASIERILKPGLGRGGSDSVDVLRNVVSKRERGRGFFAKKDAQKPYVIVMVGINGVGKSTSLAKIAYYLKSNGCNPLLAACDTFRSGAVEQLNVHAKCLNVPLYHKGYAKDPAAVAKAAILEATQQGNDVVLVDTAGRMQNNVPLMRALSNLVVQNNPDLVLFVCEALVGNDGMDQLQMFNKALQSGGHTRKIDGIVLTKFDTVSDKVGAALTMTHLTGAPVVFCGTGQKYNHLKKLSVSSVIKSLFA